VLESGGFRELVARAITAAGARSRELSRQTPGEEADHPDE
jgi:pyrroline-5-carboxylate reductase